MLCVVLYFLIVERNKQESPDERVRQESQLSTDCSELFRTVGYDRTDGMLSTGERAYVNADHTHPAFGVGNTSKLST